MQLLKRFFISSLARQFTFSVVILLAVLMSFFVYDLVSRQHEFLIKQSNKQVHGMAETLAANGASWILSNDVVGIEEIILSQSSFPELSYAMFININGKVLGYTDNNQVGRYVDDPISRQLLTIPAKTTVLYESSSFIDVAAPVFVKDRQIGWARVGVDRGEIAHSLEAVTRNGVIYILVAIILGVLFSWFITRGLSAGIQGLTQALHKVIKGERDIQCKLDRYDELGSLSNDFNHMLDTINEREEQLIESYQALDQSEQKISRLVSSLTPEYFFYSHDTNGRFTYVSPSITNVLGYTCEEFAQDFDQYFTDNPINDRARYFTQQSISGYRQLPYELETFHKNGSKHILEVTEVPVFDNHNNVIAVEGMAHDINERKHAEAALHAEKNKLAMEQALLRSLINSVPDLIFYKNHESVYMGCNKAFEEFVGYQEAEIIGKTDFDLFPQGVAEFFRKKDGEMLASSRSRQNEEWVDYPDGRKVLLDTLKTPYYGPDNKVLGLIGISRDITEQRSQEEQLRRSQKMEALGKLTGGIAHDYNNLLGVIMGYAEILGLELADNARLSKYAMEIYSAGERGGRLTRKLLAFTRKDVAAADVTDINSVLETNQQMLEKTLTARIKINMQLTGSVWPLWLDQGGLEDLILNMSINAMHAMPDGGNLTFATTNVSLAETEAQALELPVGDYVQFTVTDTGIGMDKEVCSRIFDPFYSTKGEMGSGLGLSQVYGYVHAAGGVINVYSEPGHGTRFMILFPRYFSSDAAKSDRDISEMMKSSGHETVLIVDDDEQLRQQAGETLKAYGYHVLEASQSSKALEILTNESVDLLIANVIMPEMGGCQLSTEVHKKYPQIKVLLASGFNDDRYLSTINGELKSNMLRKPFRPDDLLYRVRSMLDQK